MQASGQWQGNGKNRVQGGGHTTLSNLNINFSQPSVPLISSEGTVTQDNDAVLQKKMEGYGTYLPFKEFISAC